MAQAYATAHGLTGKVSCSTGFGGPLHVRAKDFVCLVRRSTAVCDELRVRQRGSGWRVALQRRGVDCVLPA